jgi:hypothetical protein
LKPQYTLLGKTLAAVDGVKVGACDATVAMQAAIDAEVTSFPSLRIFKACLRPGARAGS